MDPRDRPSHRVASSGSAGPDAIGVHRARGRASRVGRRAARHRRADGQLQPRGADPAGRARSRRRHGHQPLRRSVGRAPGHGHRPDSGHRSGRQDPGAVREPRCRARVERTVSAAEPGVCHGRRRLMARPSAVVGIGQTDYRRQLDVTLDGLVRWAALEALEDAGMTFADIDAIVIGKAPDALEAVMMPELSLADALGAVGKPIHRVHTARSVGASTAITGATPVESGPYGRGLVGCYEEPAEGNATWALSGGRSGGQGAGGTFAPWIRSYISRSGAPEHIGWKIAVKDRLNALKNPHAHLRIDDISIEKGKESPMLWDPLHFLESCPSSDGAAAVVLAGEALRRPSPRPPAWVVAHAKRTEFSSFPGRDPVRPVGGVDCAEALYTKAGITDPLPQIDCAGLELPFSWYEPMWLG